MSIIEQLPQFQAEREEAWITSPRPAWIRFGRIYGYRVGPLIVQPTLARLHILSAESNAYLTGEKRTRRAALRFLWALSPGFKPHRLNWRLWRILHPFTRFRDADAAIGDILEAAFRERPGASNDSGGVKLFAPTYYLAEYVDVFASRYGWSTTQILETPVAQLFHLLHVIQRSSGGDTPKFHPITDAIGAEHLRRLREKKGQK